MKAYKKHKFFIFERDDGKVVKYDLETKETIGILGKPVKGLQTQLRGYSISSVIKSFEDEKYRAFLQYVYDHFTKCGVSNIGTFLNDVKKYAIYEQYFAADITNIGTDLKTPLSEVPKQLIKYSKELKLTITQDLLNTYKKDAGIYSSVLSEKYTTLTSDEVIDFVTCNRDGYRRRWSNFYRLIDEYHYNARALLRYVDNIMTYEALSSYEAIRNLEDYTRMMSSISTKYEKYPKHLLTTHQIAVRNYNRLQEIFNEEQFKKRIDESLEYTRENYKVIYPKCTQDIKDEAVMQNNCVASYVKKVIEGECHIVFLRLREHLDKSLITMEIRDNKVHQAKGNHNRELSLAEEEFVNKYNKYLNNKIKQSTLIEIENNTIEGVMIAC